MYALRLSIHYRCILHVKRFLSCNPGFLRVSFDWHPSSDAARHTLCTEHTATRIRAFTCHTEVHTPFHDNVQWRSLTLSHFTQVEEVHCTLEYYRTQNSRARQKANTLQTTLVLISPHSASAKSSNSLSKCFFHSTGNATLLTLSALGHLTSSCSPVKSSCSLPLA